MAAASPDSLALTVFSARAGDRGGRGVAGAIALGEELAARLSVEPVTVTDPAGAWDGEPEPLEGSRPSLRLLAERQDELLGSGRVPLTAFSRCPTAMATLPVVARHRPDAAIVWFDAHPDLNVPETSATGYFGGLALAGPLGLWDTGFGAGIDPANVILVGARDIDPPEAEVIAREGITVVAPGPDLSGMLDEAVGTRGVYIHFDCDVLEPGIVPLDYEVPGGLDLDGLRAATEVLAARELVGAEIGEFETVTGADGVPGPSPAALLDAFAPLLRAASA